jgi:hypothetical protein
LSHAAFTYHFLKHFVSFQIYTTTCESMKAVPVLVCILLVITLSAAAPARKLARDDGQQTGETQTKMEVIDGRPSSGYGDHVCRRSMFPGCS